MASPQKDFIHAASEWARSTAGITGLLLVGSFARGESRSDSDVDLIVFSETPDRFLKSKDWLKGLGHVTGSMPEGAASVRVFLENGVEVDLRFETAHWASVEPVGQDAERVVTEGASVLFDPQGFLIALIERVDLRTRT